MDIKLTNLTQEQAQYLNLPQNGPFKSKLLNLQLAIDSCFRRNDGLTGQTDWMDRLTGWTDLLDGRAYWMDGLTGRTGLLEGQAYWKDRLTGRTGLLDGLTGRIGLLDGRAYRHSHLFVIPAKAGI